MVYRPSTLTSNRNVSGTEGPRVSDRLTYKFFLGSKDYYPRQTFRNTNCLGTVRQTSGLRPGERHNFQVGTATPITRDSVPVYGLITILLI